MCSRKALYHTQYNDPYNFPSFQPTCSTSDKTKKHDLQLTGQMLHTISNTHTHTKWILVVCGALYFTRLRHVSRKLYCLHICIYGYCVFHVCSHSYTYIEHRVLFKLWQKLHMCAVSLCEFIGSCRVPSALQNAEQQVGHNILIQTHPYIPLHKRRTTQHKHRKRDEPLCICRVALVRNVRTLE